MTSKNSDQSIFISNDQVDKYFKKIIQEYDSSKKRFPAFTNIDHALGVLVLKMDDLKEEIRNHKANYKIIEHELIQLANISLRALIENIDPYYKDEELDKEK